MEIHRGLEISSVRALSEKEQILAPVVEKYSAGMRKDPFGANLVQKSKIA